jgi:hypothetical protein
MNDRAHTAFQKRALLTSAMPIATVKIVGMGVLMSSLSIATVKNSRNECADVSSVSCYYEK